VFADALTSLLASSAYQIFSSPLVSVVSQTFLGGYCERGLLQSAANASTAARTAWPSDVACGEQLRRLSPRSGEFLPSGWGLAADFDDLLNERAAG
jgi:hypothetical protein